MTLGSRKELDCLVQFINDEFGEPAFEVKTMLKVDDIQIHIQIQMHLAQEKNSTALFSSSMMSLANRHLR